MIIYTIYLPSNIKYKLQNLKKSNKGHGRGRLPHSAPLEDAPVRYICYIVGTLYAIVMHNSIIFITGELFRLLDNI